MKQYKERALESQNEEPEAGHIMNILTQNAQLILLFYSNSNVLGIHTFSRADIGTEQGYGPTFQLSAT